MKFNKNDLIKVLKYYQIDYQDRYDFFVMKTVCHNHENSGSNKLYAYFNDNNIKMVCYTSCGSMDLISFIEHYLECGYGQAIDKLKSILGNIEKNIISTPVFNPVRKLKTKKHEQQKIEIINENILNDYYPYPNDLWIHEGISIRSQLKYGIHFSILDNKIIIPQRDSNGNLIGVRGRALNQDEIDIYGKYRPIVNKGKVLKYPIGHSLYGMWENKKNIISSKKAILFEAEKSVLMHDTMTNGKSNALALSGSSISQWQIESLSRLGINELIIALDKDYSSLQEMKIRQTIMEKLLSPLRTRFIVTIVWDELDGLLGYKDSPIDKGEKIFNSLLKNRLIL